MKTIDLIAVNEFCVNHNIEISFISSLQKSGLIEIITIKETGFINTSQLKDLERFILFHYEFDINLEGIETIAHLLRRLTSMQDEMISLKNRLRLYENNE